MFRQNRDAMSPISASILIILSTLTSLTNAFYLPGVAPTNYKLGDRVPLNVNTLRPSDSDKDTTIHSSINYDYYRPEFHFCQPEGGPQSISESLGSILFGDRIYNSPFELKMGVNETCKNLCGAVKIPAEDADLINNAIVSNFNLNWLVDGLPAGQLKEDEGVRFESPGFPLGQVDGSDFFTPYLNTHYEIIIDYHKAGEDQYRVVGVIVEPLSLKDSSVNPDGTANCVGSPDDLLQLMPNQDSEVVWTYSVYWQESPTSFATRWDKYLHVYDPKIHWFSLVNSAIVVCFLVGMVSTILVRTLRKDIARYNRLDQVNLDDLSGTGIMDDGVQEDSGWKLVHGDVFRQPRYPLPLSVLLGNGAQLFFMAGFTIAFALLGFLSPSNRGSLATVMLLLYSLMALPGGYVAARTYKFFNGEGWRRLFIYTPVVGPLFIFSTFFLLNLFVWFRGASGAVPFTTMLVLALIWFIISVPLSLAGSWLGFKHAQIVPPVRTNQIPRQIPANQSTWMKPIPSSLLVGILPFGAIFVELYFIMNSIWTSKIYYMFGFLFICYGIMIITTAAITVLMIYFLLCAEDYHWQWRSFFTAGACSFYVFAYAMLFWLKTLSFSSWTGGVLYLGYSALISVLFFVLTGTIGFFASWLFVMRIYSSIKVD